MVVPAILKVDLLERPGRNWGPSPRGPNAVMRLDIETRFVLSRGPGCRVTRSHARWYLAGSPEQQVLVFNLLLI